ncbi:hypothetical protein, partial [Armatimonas sp.]|uniref:hypothetical protein n=1 Tax=Armatimonas sp. TaxID=1872638 RepID=UPI003753A94C
MSLTLDPEIETQVRREAARRGVSPQDFLRGTLNSVRVHSPELAPRPLGTSGHLSGCPVPFELRL